VCSTLTISWVLQISLHTSWSSASFGVRASFPQAINSFVKNHTPTSLSSQLLVYLIDSIHLAYNYAQWGDGHYKESAEECCAACRARFVSQRPCNVWAWCAKPEGCDGRKHKECWCVYVYVRVHVNVCVRACVMCVCNMCLYVFVCVCVCYVNTVS